MQVGSLVELIDDNWDLCIKSPFETYPVKGVIYTVRDFFKQSIMLEEIINPPMRYSDSFGEAAFRMVRFREVQPPMTITIEELLSEPVTA